MTPGPGGAPRFFRPDGRRLTAVGVRTRGDVQELCAEHRRVGRRIDGATAASLSNERFDLGLAVEGLLRMAPLGDGHDAPAERFRA